MGSSLMATYLVAGAAGFIGARVSTLLLDAGHRVVGVDNLNDAYDVRLKEWRLAQLIGREGMDFVRLDITDRDALAALEECPDVGALDAVINLAARAGVRSSVEDPWAYLETNVTGALNLLELCRRRGIAKYVLASSSSVYGRSAAMPYREDGDADRPLSPYAASKKAAEALSYTYHFLYNIDVTVFRYFTVYGPAGRPDMAPFRFTQWVREGRPVLLYGDGSQRRDFTYVDDIARGTILGLRPLGYEIINLGSDRPVALREMLGQLEVLTGCRAQLDCRPVHPADVPATWADIGKAQRLLGWQPQVTLAEGLAALVGWYEREREWAREIATD